MYMIEYLGDCFQISVDPQIYGEKFRVLKRAPIKHSCVIHGLHDQNVWPTTIGNQEK